MTDFESIYNQYFKDVYRFVASISRDPTVAEEITQETFFKAAKSMYGYAKSPKTHISPTLISNSASQQMIHLNQQVMKLKLTLLI